MDKSTGVSALAKMINDGFELNSLHSLTGSSQISEEVFASLSSKENKIPPKNISKNFKDCISVDSCVLITAGKHWEVCIRDETGAIYSQISNEGETKFFINDIEVSVEDYPYKVQENLRIPELEIGGRYSLQFLNSLKPIPYPRLKLSKEKNKYLSNGKVKRR